MRRPRHWILGAGLGLVGCTFSGLADYDIASCDPTLPLEQDACNALNQGNTSCQRWQCSAATRRCVLSTLDADKDGDPPIDCGGKDCDDRNPARSGNAKEICDAIDNDCDGVTGNGLLAVGPTPKSTAPLDDRRVGGADPRLGSADGRDGYATYLGTAASCVHGFILGDAPGDAGCLSVATGDAGSDGGGDAASALARNAEVANVGVQRDSTTGVTFIEQHPTTGCAKEQLAFANRATGAVVLADCGAALPSLVSFPLLPEALIAFYDVRTSERANPIEGCAAAQPAPLRLRWVDRPTTDPEVTTSAAIALGNATATRPPALFPVASSAYVLLASPFETSVGLWQLTPDGRVVPLATAIPALEGARSVALSVATEGEITRLAIVAERGCRPNQSLTMVVATFDPSNATFPESLRDPTRNPFRETAIVAGPAAVATAPAIAWVAGRHEWWVTWIDERQKAVLRRVSSDGAKADDAIDLGDAALATLKSAAELPGLDAGSGLLPASAFLLRRDESAIDEIALSCRAP